MTPSHLDPRAELLARIDAATICDALSVSIGGATRQDVHQFGYLASMVNSQYGASPTAWGYRFAASATGFPFAEALDFAMDKMSADGDLLGSPDGFQLSEGMRERIAVAAAGASFGERILLIEDVANVAVFRALPTIGRALRGEPQLARSSQLKTVRLIDEEELAQTLMRLLLDVRDELPDVFPPAVPAMHWLDRWERANER